MQRKGIHLNKTGKARLFSHLSENVCYFKPNLNTCVNFKNIIQLTTDYNKPLSGSSAIHLSSAVDGDSMSAQSLDGGHVLPSIVDDSDDNSIFNDNIDTEDVLSVTSSSNKSQLFRD